MLVTVLHREHLAGTGGGVDLDHDVRPLLGPQRRQSYDVLGQSRVPVQQLEQGLGPEVHGAASTAPLVAVDPRSSAADSSLRRLPWARAMTPLISRLASFHRSVPIADTRAVAPLAASSASSWFIGASAPFVVVDVLATLADGEDRAVPRGSDELLH